MSLKDRTRILKQEAHAIYLAVRDPRTPKVARVIGGAAVAYALSPIDLIPDFIPVLGYLDDVLIVPLGLWLALRMIPAEVLQDARDQARAAATPAGDEHETPSDS
ncbi:MAG TPA: YkvA family protein [Coriobacteriia bacterium]|nr:YkvA family protein [Coriobacteriia bacterium]